MNGKTQIKTGLIFEDVDIWNGQYGRYLYDKDGKCSKFEGYGRAVYLDSVNKIIETGEVLLKLSFEFGGVTNTIRAIYI